MMMGDGTIKFRRRQAEAISGPIREYLRSTGLLDGLYRNKVFEAWDTLSGAGQYTINKYLKDNVLYINLSSSALRNRLQCRLPLIMKTINEATASDELFCTPSGDDVGARSWTVPQVTRIVLR